MEQGEINKQIFERLKRLEKAIFRDGKTKHEKSKPEKFSGATGSLRMLVNEKYFDNPKQLSEIIESLKQEGRHYLGEAISMGLLNLVRERILTRFRDRGDNKWKYIIRK